ncbi:20844_t:CDS:2 [Dentiscutata erythropus]|uniref:20844_t:CDS:1 n=1 Tax=Dentiscutata erythropus TaxID=1348616 RepID=A0A9N9IA93_9GLOM|nr:20844_t:CDS:2 [Dentiscutata erythropus]
MDQNFSPEHFETIFRSLPTDKDLHSCLLVNKYWAACAVPILWEAPFGISDSFTPSPKVIQTYLAFIPDRTTTNSNEKLSINKAPLFDYPSFLKEFSYDRFITAAVTNNCSKYTIIELLKILSIRDTKLRRFKIYDHLFSQYFNRNNRVASLVLPHFSECTSIFSSLTYFNCSYQWPVQKAQLFNSIANNCRYIKKIKVSVWHEDEGIALANLIRSQKHLKKFSLINSNIFASFPIQALVDQKWLNSVTFEDMHENRNLCDKEFFNYTICELNNDAINALAQCTNINKVKFKHCEGLNSPLFLPISYTFTNLISLEYSYGTYKINDRTTPIKLLSSLIEESCDTLKKIILDWHSDDHIDITQLIETIARRAINLEYLKIPLYTLEDLALIHQANNQLKKLELYILNRRINLYCILFLFANVPLKITGLLILFYAYINN